MPNPHHCRCGHRLSKTSITEIVDLLHNRIQFYDQHGEKNNTEYSYLIETALNQECHHCYLPTCRRRR